MPKPSLYALIWSPKDHTYELYAHPFLRSLLPVGKLGISSVV
jgi:hypothetical protein